MKIDYKNLDWNWEQKGNKMTETKNFAKFAWDSCSTGMHAICEYKQQAPDREALLAGGWTEVPTDDENTNVLFWKVKVNEKYTEWGHQSRYCKETHGLDSQLAELRSEQEYQFLKSWAPANNPEKAKSLVLGGKNEYVYRV